MSYRCPEGHTSQSGDYCDVCGAPIAPAAPSAPAPRAADPTTAIPTGPAVCPNCSYPNEAGALFCENCGYDFTTGSLPEADPFTESGAVRAPGEVGGSATPAGDPTAHLGEAPAPAAPGAPPALVPEEEAGFDVPVATAPPTAPATEVLSEVTGSTPTAAPAAPAAAEEDDPWIAEIWVDPDWYAEQRAEDPMPSGGPPTIVVLRERSLLVGRPSVSRGISPQIDCGTDSGVSRRHCQLNTDGYRWWVEDLQSANGTYLAAAGAPLPQTPIPTGQRREIEEGDRVYVGAWTRIVLRQALPGEA
ncbi:FHA domain-containing protein [Rathayibacter sp. VKM Ac-2928]|uniref:FHA domain-containing protein n=1 Tax=Rathayibacter sp. VKM Ac-2928 TaxID=2929479 RepID=UPI001FB2256E|nr:FHA domain-containing protein [Rathayibacter sp. VKM Ac-2928]MCJ1681790.1 FHA domain-containing protein [Rathayibacter sp. VKM Ac-2928]